MATNLVQLFPREESSTSPNKWIGRIAIFEMVTGSRVQGKILNVNDEWIDTDNGAVRVAFIVSAKWVGNEEAAIIRGGPLLNGSFSSPKQIR